MVKFYDVSFLQTNFCGCSYSTAAMSFQVMKYCAIDEIKRESGLNRGDEWVGNGKKNWKRKAQKSYGTVGLIWSVVRSRQVRSRFSVLAP
jgi:hypothetical protein